MKIFLMIAVILSSVSIPSFAKDLEVGSAAPLFQVQTHENKTFDLSAQKGKWTILYFYPKADTPGCTKQACAYRDGIKKITDLGAEVYGVSADTVKSQAEFHEKYHLNFPLLADADGKVIAMYGSKMPVVSMSKRWTFIIDPTLKIRSIEKNVDPVADSTKTAAKIEELKKQKL